MDWLTDLLRPLDTLSQIPLYSVGKTTITLGTMLYLTVLVVALFYATAKLKTWIVEGLLSRSHVDLGVRHAIGAIVRYIVVAIGLVIILQTAGINLSTLTVLFGALGIGVGFGLQSITNNFVSGIILLLERPIKVGDRIEVGDVHGDVVNISPRATTIVTNDNIAIIVPNADFISSKVVNWSYTNRDVRFNFPIGVSYGSDPEQVRRILLEVAQAHRGVLKEPGPSVLLDGFGDSSLNFVLRVWTREFSTIPGVLRSELYFSICRAFKEEGIEIPFPQRDLHIKSGTLNVRQVSAQEPDQRR
ncbi:MAG: mechanosensitive ion channel [Nitrospira sp.]|nr:mechanosensitive ion channel [Nitrospira sp.]MDH5337000.1 mechanosensitive ion channel [Nitrospira sp.]